MHASNDGRACSANSTWGIRTSLYRKAPLDFRGFSSLFLPPSCAPDPTLWASSWSVPITKTSPSTKPLQNVLFWSRTCWKVNVTGQLGRKCLVVVCVCALGKTLIVAHWLDVGDSDAPIPLPNVNAKILRKVSDHTSFGRVKVSFNWRVSYNQPGHWMVRPSPQRSYGISTGWARSP